LNTLLISGFFNPFFFHALICKKREGKADISLAFTFFILLYPPSMSYLNDIGPIRDGVLLIV